MARTLSTYLALIISGTVLAGLAFVSVLFFVDPTVAGWVGHSFFFLALFLFTAGLSTLCGLFIRNIISKDTIANKAQISFRQGLLIATLVIALIILQMLNLLFWWVGITIILFIITLEIFLNA